MKSFEGPRNFLFLMKIFFLSSLAKLFSTAVLMRLSSSFWLEVLSTRQRRRNREQGIPTGIAKTTDYFYFSSSSNNVSSATSKHLSRRHVSIFLFSGLKPSEMTKCLESAALADKAISIVIAGDDRTFPRQTDLRFGPNSQKEVKKAFEIANLPNVVGLLVENLDMPLRNSRPLPAGIWPQGPLDHSFRRIDFEDFPKKEFEKLVFCAHRLREGPQFDARRKVFELSDTEWRDFTTTITKPLRHSEFLNELRRHPFTLCVEGGGIDPSPKAFEALLNGSIPIVRNSSVSAAYKGLPVFFVDDWDGAAVNEKNLIDFYRTFNKTEYWRMVRKKLSSSYWTKTGLLRKEGQARGVLKSNTELGEDNWPGLMNDGRR